MRLGGYGGRGGRGESEVLRSMRVGGLWGPGIRGARASQVLRSVGLASEGALCSSSSCELLCSRQNLSPLPQCVPCNACRPEGNPTALGPSGEWWNTNYPDSHSRAAGNTALNDLPAFKNRLRRIEYYLAASENSICIHLYKRAHLHSAAPSDLPAAGTSSR